MRRQELFDALLAAVAVLLASRYAGQTALVPCGVAAGAAVGLDGDAAADGVAVSCGARAGALLFVVATASMGFARPAPVVGPAFAVGWSMFTGVAMAPLLIPLYAVEGVIAPLVAVGRRAAVRAVRSRAR